MTTKLIAKTLLINQDGQILALRRSATDTHRPGAWDLPGGALDAGEDPVRGAVREIKEETGLTVPHIKPFAIRSAYKRPDNFMVYMIFVAQVPGSVVSLSDEHEAFRWLNLPDFSQLDLPDRYKQAATDYLTG